MKRVTIHNYKTGELVGNASMDFAKYDAQYPAPANPGAVRAGDWLDESALGSNNLDADTTVWFEEL